MFNCEYVLESVLHQFMRCIVRFWTEEFQRFYNPVVGLDIDGAWIDMNEPTNVSRCFMRKLLLFICSFAAYHATILSSKPRSGMCHPLVVLYRLTLLRPSSQTPVAV